MRQVRAQIETSKLPLRWRWSRNVAAGCNVTVKQAEEWFDRLFLKKPKTLFEKDVQVNPKP